ncbi:hypothetical protein [Actinoplanes sp. L3-i22]|uniref:hypothetical protein n=1 Tax=Actinoplanes sp. L3-i22 TaxID=2836373 RepID=UPI001C77FF22|nr:hypothetical protein [Actinoplanes sp. L3-i22]BCY08941.1 hypothetical protein L3i22_040290 [Actinoplanes sp. L3-i22]
MCLLSFLPAGVQPNLPALRNGSLINDDGHGFAIVVAGRLLVRHSMNADQLIDEFAAARHAFPDGDALFHSRLATGGTSDLANCHPYAVGGDQRTVLAHNGILPVRLPRHEARSDTRVAAEDLIPRMGSLRSRLVRLRLERWMGADNKIVILTVDRRFRHTSYLLNERAGEWADGVWYSNSGYLPWPDPEPGWCGYDLAGTCGDCGQLDGYCLCRHPMSRF